MNTQLVPNKNKLAEFSEYFKSKTSGIAHMIARHMTPERVCKIAVAALARNPVLMQCKPPSVWLCVANAASLGLEIDLLGSAYLVPFRNGKTGGYDCQLLIGYQGLIELARRSGEVKDIQARVVHKADRFRYSYGDTPKLEHEPAASDRGEVIGAYAIAWLSSGATNFEYMSKEDIDAIRSRSRASNIGPWVSDYNEMARKTVARRLIKYLPKAIELKQALTIEDAAEDGKTAIAGFDHDVEVIETLPDPVDRAQEIVNSASEQPRGLANAGGFFDLNEKKEEA